MLLLFVHIAYTLLYCTVLCYMYIMGTLYSGVSFFVIFTNLKGVVCVKKNATDALQWHLETVPLCVFRPTVCTPAHCVYSGPLCVLRPTVCTPAHCVYSGPLCVLRPTVCTPAHCVYSGPLCVLRPTVCTPAHCVYSGPLCVLRPTVCTPAHCVYSGPLCVLRPTVCTPAHCVYSGPLCVLLTVMVMSQCTIVQDTFNHENLACSSKNDVNTVIQEINAVSY